MYVPEGAGGLPRKRRKEVLVKDSFTLIIADRKRYNCLFNLLNKMVNCLRGTVTMFFVVVVVVFFQ